ncbi:MAG: hypothetical protein M0P70_09970 [Desulfobulbaceae bacterium]|nr:hypothetical protein [Desulfobulbaceae bacterium]
MELIRQSVKKTEKNHRHACQQGSLVPGRRMEAVEAAGGQGAVGDGVQQLVQPVDGRGQVLAWGIGKKKYDDHDNGHGQKSADHGKKVNYPSLF